MLSKEELVDRVMTEIDAKCPVTFNRDEFNAAMEQLLKDDKFKRAWDREFGMPIGKWLVKNEYIVKGGSTRLTSKRNYKWGYTSSGKSTSTRLRFFSRRRYRINRKKWPIPNKR